MLAEISKLIVLMLVVGQLVEPLVNIIKKYGNTYWEKMDKYTKQIIVIVVGIAVTLVIYYLDPTAKVLTLWESIIVGIGSSLDARMLHDIASYLEKLKQAKAKAVKDIPVQKLEG